MKKNHTLKGLLVAAVMFLFSGTAFAQIESSIYLNFNIPVGDFSEDANFTTIMNKEFMGSDAVFGIGATYRAGYIFDIEVGLIEPFGELGINWNRISGDNRDKYDAYDGRIPNYFNIPLMVGVNYRYDRLSETFVPYAEFGLGYDLFFTNGEGADALKRLYKGTGGFAYQIGVGCIIGRYFSAGLSFVSYGSHDIKYTQGTLDDHASLSNTPVVHRTLNNITFKLGFHF